MPDSDLLASHAARADAEARAMFRFMLAHWARDVLALRASGLDRPAWRPGQADLAPLAHDPRGGG